VRTVLPLLALLAATAAHAQLGPDELVSRLSLTLDGETHTQVGPTSSTTYAQRNASLDFAMLFGRPPDTERAPTLLLPFLTATASVARIDLSTLSTPRTVQTLAAGGGLLLRAGRETYLLGGSLGESAESSVVDSRSVRVGAFGMGSYHFSRDVAGLYGATFGYLFGEARLLPLLGARWSISPAVALAVLLPLYARLAWRAQNDLRLDLSLGLSGARQRLALASAFPGATTIELGTARGELSVGARYFAAQRLRLDATAGLRAGGRVFVDNGNSRLYDEHPSAAAFGRLAVVFYFGTLSRD
jgi:hypothetical protein